MAQIDEVYDFLRSKYADNEPIFLSDIRITGIKDAVLRQYIRQLILEDKIKRFDAGIYFFPKKSIFKSGSTLSMMDVINRKYLSESGQSCGYISGLMFANQIGATTQIAAVYEIYTNKATTAYRETKLANQTLIFKKPCVTVTDENASVLQLMDFLKEAVAISELDIYDLKIRISDYMKTKEIAFSQIERYLSYYPERIYKNMYEVGLLSGLSS